MEREDVKRLSSCAPVGKGCCGTLFFDPGCSACQVAADLVHLADLRGSITLRPWPGVGAPQFERVLDGTHVVHLEDSLYGGVVAELLGVDQFQGQQVINDLLRLLLNIARAFVVWSHGERVPWGVVLGMPGRAKPL